jgi:hypothetical protein
VVRDLRSRLLISAERLLTLAVLLVAVLLFPILAPYAPAGLGDCSQPRTDGPSPTATDCLTILRAAVGLETCDPECICAPNGSLPVVATSALVCLKKAVGLDVELACPCTTTTLPSPEELIAAIDVPERTISVEMFSDNNNLPAFADELFPELESLRAHGVDAVSALTDVLDDVSLDTFEDSDRLRALVALALERIGDSSAVPSLVGYVERAKLQHDPVMFFSAQAAVHALAVLTGQTSLVRGLYDAVTLEQVLAGATGLLVPIPWTFAMPMHVLPSTAGNEIDHAHLVGPGNVPPNGWPADFDPGIRQARDELVTLKQDGFALFEDPIVLLESATRTYDCHSFTFRRGDNYLAEPTDRYHIYGEAVPGILADEGYTDITDKPFLWRAGDAIVFYKEQGGTPTHTGRLSGIGSSFADPDLRFVSKWSVTLPVIDVSVRDCMKLYGKIAEVWARPILYAASSSSLYIVEKETGFATFVGDFGISDEMGAIAATSGGALYGITTGANASLYSIHAITGAADYVGYLGLNVFEGGLAYDPRSGDLIGVNAGGPSDTVAFRIDPETGSRTLIGPTPGQARELNGLAFFDGTLYAIDETSNTIGTVDLDSGTYTPGPTITGATIGSVGGLAVDPLTGTFYALLDGLSLYQVDHITGTATRVGGQALADRGLTFGPLRPAPPLSTVIYRGNVNFSSELTVVGWGENGSEKCDATPEWTITLRPYGELEAQILIDREAVNGTGGEVWCADYPNRQPFRVEGTYGDGSFEFPSFRSGSPDSPVTGSYDDNGIRTDGQWVEEWTAEDVYPDGGAVIGRETLDFSLPRIAQ